MIKFVRENQEAVDCLRSHFLGHLDDFVRIGVTQIHLAQSLAALGVLTPNNESREFKMSSPMIDSLIRQQVIPFIFRSVPQMPPPIKHRADRPAALDCLAMLREAVKLFSKTLIRGAESTSYKYSRGVQVGGNKNARVPRESVYDSELMRILSNWLVQMNYTVTGQWHTKIDNGHRYCDIVIAHNYFKVVLELIATGEVHEIKKHIDRTNSYKHSLRATEGWMIHFTREDDYLDHPWWQSDEMVQENIYVVHIHHNREFMDVKMSAKYRDSQGEDVVIEKEQIIQGIHPFTRFQAIALNLTLNPFQ